MIWRIVNGLAEALVIAMTVAAVAALAVLVGMAAMWAARQ